MPGELDDGVDDKPAHRRDNLLWGLLYIGLGLGGSGSYLAVSGTDDRIRKAEVVASLALRDAEIRHIHELYEVLRADLERIDANHPPRELIDTLKDHEGRLRLIERTK